MGDARQLMVQLPGFVVMVILLIEFIQKKPGLAGMEKEIFNFSKNKTQFNKQLHDVMALFLLHDVVALVKYSIKKGVPLEHPSLD
jgi:hypothetical protein